MRTLLTKVLPHLLVIVFIFLVRPSIWAQNTETNTDTGLSGSLETNHQTYFYKDPNKAFLLALFPGILIHGYGHFYADDNLTGDVLLTGEVVSVVSVGFGALILSDTNTFSGGILGNSNNANTIGTDLIWGGIITFTALWVVDMAHSPVAAQDYDDEHDLKPIAYIDQNHPTLAVAYRF